MISGLTVKSSPRYLFIRIKYCSQESLHANIYNSSIQACQNTEAMTKDVGPLIVERGNIVEPPHTGILFSFKRKSAFNTQSNMCESYMCISK